MLGMETGYSVVTIWKEEMKTPEDMELVAYLDDMKRIKQECKDSETGELLGYTWVIDDASFDRMCEKFDVCSLRDEPIMSNTKFLKRVSKHWQTRFEEEKNKIK